jgi:hypothetical protein
LQISVAFGRWSAGTSLFDFAVTAGPARNAATSRMSVSVIVAACECIVPCERSPLL